jgi:serine/threonine-protein kinase
MRSIGFLIIVVLAAWIPPRAARAQATEKAAAEALFDEGRQLFNAGKYPEACKKFEASQALDAGIGTLLYLADCYSKTGRTASAWATFLEAASTAKAQGQAEREAVARNQARALEPKIPKLNIRMSQGEAPAGFELLHNGRLIPEGSWGTPLPVDPGPQKLEARAPGKQTWTTTVEVEPGQMTTDVEIPKLEDQPVQAETGAGTESRSTSVQDEGASGSTQLSVGFVMGGAGLVALGVGGFFGLQAISKNNESEENCRTATLCTPTGVALREDAQSAATISTIAVGVGAALAAAGVVLVLSAPSGERTQAMHTLRLTGAASPSGASISVGGAW